MFLCYFVLEVKDSLVSNFRMNVHKVFDCSQKLFIIMYNCKNRLVFTTVKTGWSSQLVHDCVEWLNIRCTLIYWYQNLWSWPICCIWWLIARLSLRWSLPTRAMLSADSLVSVEMFQQIGLEFGPSDGHIYVISLNNKELHSPNIAVFIQSFRFEKVLILLLPIVSFSSLWPWT